jgi:hypothetical protein
MVLSEAEEIFVTAGILRDKMFVMNGYTKDCEGRDRSQFKAS